MEKMLIVLLTPCFCAALQNTSTWRAGFLFVSFFTFGIYRKVGSRGDQKRVRVQHISVVNSASSVDWLV